jgi:subtilisin family serine protease
MIHISPPQPGNRLLERLKKSIGRKVCLMFTLLAVSLSQVPAQQVSNPAVPTADANLVDAAEQIVADGQIFKLKRVGNQIVVKARAGADRLSRDTAAIPGGKTLRRVRQLADRIAVWQDDAAVTDDSARLQSLLTTARADSDAEFVFPVYRAEGSDFNIWATDELIIEIDPRTDPDAWARILERYQLGYLRPVVATEDGHVLRLLHPKQQDVLTLVDILSQDPEVLAARHNFLIEIRADTHPSDTLQRHLTSEAAGNSDPNANIKAYSAWSGSQPYGSPGIVVAILDNGFQMNHPDLAANMLPGYDFLDADSDPSPSDNVPFDPDNHGTAVAGMVAAAANGFGVAGAAPNCKILPIRMWEGTHGAATGDKVKAALVYAADHADVIVCSWSYGLPNTDVTAGFQYAATHGRKVNGVSKGAIAIASAGNYGSKWHESATYIAFDPGVYKGHIQKRCFEAPGVGWLS